MIIKGPAKIVLLGMMGRMRVGGAVWQAIHYLIGLRELGYDPYYVEAHGCMPWAFQIDESGVAAFVDSVMRRFDLGDRWAFHARSGSGKYYGMSEPEVSRLYKSAAAIINLHGGTVPTAEQSATGRLVYIDTDPVIVQVEISNRVESTLDILDQHCALFTFAENYGNRDCGLPVSDSVHFKATRQPVVLDLWRSTAAPAGHVFTTIGNWKQLRRVVDFNGEEYHWSKHLEFLKFLDLPGRTSQSYELSLSACDDEERETLVSHGWSVRDTDFTHDLDKYRDYILESRGEFTVAKDQNIRLRTGWFSDRSATYLAAGCPVVTQETGFSNILPTGRGLFAFSTIDDAVAAIEAINSDYERHRHAAEDLAREYFSHDIVLSRLLAEIGIRGPQKHSGHRERYETSVNVVGDFSSCTGMRATADGYVRALEWAGFTVTKTDLSSENGLETTDVRSQINLICCEVASHFSVWSRLSEEFFRDRYNIGVWLWESPNFPKAWYDRFVFYDEIWAPTSFIASTLSPVAPIPVIRVPFVLQPRVRGSRSTGRRSFGIDDSEFVCVFILNFHSRFQRKNPIGVIESFNNAFTPEDPARLIIKVTNADFDREHFAELQRSAQGRRISIYDGRWSERQIADLIAASDCYLSLHRSEGVGLTISDAMSAGKPVVATGWSGNMDFMNVSNSFPVRYRLVELDQNVANYRIGDVWAEPSIEHASEILQYVFRHRAEANKRGERARRDIERDFSASALGELLAARLAVITKRRQFQSLKEALRVRAEDVDGIVQGFSELEEYLPEKQFRYEGLKADLRRIIHLHVPQGSTVAVVSKGDEELVGRNGCRAWHFPLDKHFQYAGYYPKNSAEAIEQLEAVRANGGDFLLFPSTAFWWLDHYAGFREHLVARYHVEYRDSSCVMFRLSEKAAAGM